MATFYCWFDDDDAAVPEAMEARVPSDAAINFFAYNDDGGGDYADVAVKHADGHVERYRVSRSVEYDARQLREKPRAAAKEQG
jgi:hypothetical protein